MTVLLETLVGFLRAILRLHLRILCHLGASGAIFGLSGRSVGALLGLCWEPSWGLLDAFADPWGARGSGRLREALGGPERSVEIQGGSGRHQQVLGGLGMPWGALGGFGE